MSLVFAAFTPHPPLLIPTIGKNHLKKISQTQAALQKLEEDLYLSRPDVFIIISPHGQFLPEAFSINFSNQYESDLREFGDLTTKLSFKGDPTFPFQLRSKAKAEGMPVTIVSEKRLDHGTVVPLFYLTPHLPNIPIVPVGFCDRDAKTHLDFGYILKDQIMKTTKRVAIIASGDLSHALTSDAPAGFNPAGQIFDQKIQELLTAHNTSGLVQLDGQLITAAAECGFRSLLILLGALRNINYSYRSYSYEGPFGVGYLTANFVV